MRNEPSAIEILAAVTERLRAGPLTPLEQRIAANALALVGRDLDQSGAARAAEQESLQSLLGTPGELDPLNRLLGERIRGGDLRPDDPQLLRHLQTTIEARMRIDQPDYPAFRHREDR